MEAGDLPDSGRVAQEMIDLLALWLERYRAGAPYSHRPLMIAPDPEYSRKGYRRVMFFKRQAGAFAHYAKTEYWAPEDELGALIWALYEDQDRLPAFEDYRTPTSDHVRDILVCTHGTRACAKVGDVITMKPQSQQLACCRAASDEAHLVPYLRPDKTTLTITVTAPPIPGEVPIICDLPQVIEFYSR